MTGLPLEGIRVLDFGHVVAIPFCGQLLGWMGAEVVFVESRSRPVGMRGFPPFAHDREGPNTSPGFNMISGNKMSCTLNLRTPQGMGLVKELIRISDVVMDQFSTGTMEKLGLGYQDLRKVKPDIIMLSLGALGRTGPMKDYTGMHSAVNLFSGVAAVTGYPGGFPRILGSILPDEMNGMYCFLAVLLALYHRKRTGQGQYIDAAMSDVFAQMIPEAFFDYSVNGREAQRIGNRDRIKAPHGVYRCQGDDAWVAISVSSDEEWKGLCRVLERPDLLEDPRFAEGPGRRHHQDHLDSIIDAWSRGLAASEAARRLQEAGVPAGPCFNARDLLEDPHLNERGFVVTFPHAEAGPHKGTGVPWKISNMSPTTYRPAPLLGEHTSTLLHDLLGLPEEALERLSQEKVTY